MHGEFAATAKMEKKRRILSSCSRLCSSCCCRVKLQQVGRNSNQIKSVPFQFSMERVFIGLTHTCTHTHTTHIQRESTTSAASGKCRRLLLIASHLMTSTATKIVSVCVFHVCICMYIYVYICVYACLCLCVCVVL